jgi:hypothetical protein
MAWVATAIAGSAIVGAVASSQASKAQAGAASDAADASVQAARENTEFQKWLYEDQKVQQQPWVDVGLKALGQLQRYAGVDKANTNPPSLVRKEEQVAIEEEAKAVVREQEIRDMSDKDYIDYVYREGLGREPDLKGQQYWGKAVANGMDREALAKSMGAAQQGFGGPAIKNSLYVPSYDEVKKKEDEAIIERQNALIYGGVR